MRLLQGHEGKREDVKLEVNAGPAAKFLLTAHLPATSTHPTHKWWVRPRKQETRHFDAVRWAGLSVPDSWNAQTYARNLTVNAVEVQYAEMQRPSDKIDDVWARARETPFYGVLSNEQEQQPSLMMFQHIVTLPYSLTFSLVPADKADELPASDVHRLVDQLGERVSGFQQRFDTVFPLTSEYATASHKHFAQAALSNMLGGIGYFHGKSLIEHTSVVTTKGADGRERKQKKSETKKTAPLGLLATVPSRSFFPRGFLWDEGFHQLLVSRFDVRLSVEILRNWVGLILPNGWLPREQILGEEARRRVPAQFQVQRPTIANPPVLLLAMGRMVTRLDDRLRARAAGVKVQVSGDGSVSGQASSGEDETLDGDVASLTEFLAASYPILQKHADWYFHTQSAVPIPKAERGNASSALSSPVTFRWAGRTLDHCLASGLDDYPRAPFLPKPADAFAKRDGGEQHSSLREGEGVEGHVDLHAWMVALTNTMAHIASFLARQTDGGEARWGEARDAYRAKSGQLLGRLDELHWNADKAMYCDYAYRHGQHHHICHAGYVSLIPFALGLVRPSSADRLAAVLSTMQSSGLWTEWGLRSLSSEDAKFATDENYWRGAVWININYLAIVALAQYAHLAPHSSGLLSSVLSILGGGSGGGRRSDEFAHLLDHSSPIRWGEEQTSGLDGARLTAMYEGLRSNVVNNIHQQYETKGYLYENYNSTDGNGRGSHPFTGWTALVVNVMAEKY